MLLSVHRETLARVMVLSARCFIESDPGGDSLKKIPIAL